MQDQNKTSQKILMYGKHIAWIETEMLIKLDTIIKKQKKNRNQWIREKCKDDFSFMLDNIESIKKLDFEVKKHLYKDKAEWLRAKIREEIRKN